MANRHTLHISKLETFKEWLQKDGWELLPLSKNCYEVLRASKPGRKDPLIIYSKASAKEHLTVADRDYPVVAAFLRDEKRPKTHGDRIRAMSDEELAGNMMCPNENGLGEIECNQDDSCNCYECILKWLQSEVEEQQWQNTQQKMNRHFAVSQVENVLRKQTESVHTAIIIVSCIQFIMILK